MGNDDVNNKEFNILSEKSVRLGRQAQRTILKSMFEELIEKN